MDFEKVSKLDPNDVINKIGDLYNFEEVPSEVANRVQDMTDLQDDIGDLLNEVVALRDSYAKATEEITNLKQTNTKLMYDSIKRNPKPKREEVEKDAIKQSENVALNIDIYED